MDSFKFAKYRYRLAYKLVWLANRLVRPPEEQWSYNYWPKFRPIDQEIKPQGSYQPDHKYTCGAYSWEGLKSYSEQDGSDGASAKTTVKSFISADGWQDLSDMTPRQITREFAMSGMVVEFPDEAYEDNSGASVPLTPKTRGNPKKSAPTVIKEEQKETTDGTSNNS